MTRVRFAPSPTGNLHIGGARTALFNWMYAKATGGTFILRIEDTDQVRSKEEYLTEIMESMRWLGLDWDELYKQSDRFEIYRMHAEQLIKKGFAYKDGEAVLLKMPRKEVKWFDLIRGEITFDTENFIERNEDKIPILGSDGQTILRDEVLIKADGSPAYSFCCVIDDALMEMTTIIRGEDHISNTPKQLVIYEALGFKPPKFAHLPLILGEDGTRMSKRHGAVAVSDYKKQGFLPDAIVNYLMLLGWSPGTQEIISLDNAVKKFSIKKVNKAAAAFSMNKLKHINSEYFKLKTPERVLEILKPYLTEQYGDISRHSGESLKSIVHLFKGRIATVQDFLDWTQFFFQDALIIDNQALLLLQQENKSEELRALHSAIQGLKSFSAKDIELAFKETLEKLQVTPKDMIHPFRVALTGMAVGPSLFEMASLIGLERVLLRIEQAIKLTKG